MTPVSLYLGTRRFFAGAVMNSLKGAGAILAGILAMAALYAVVMLFLRGVAYGSEIIIPWLMSAAGFAFWICLLVLLPLSFFRTTRVFSLWGLMAASFVFGAFVWVWGFLVTYSLWGLLGLVIGLFIFGVGVVPVGIVAALLHGEWTTMCWLIGLVVLTFGTRGYALYVAQRADQDAVDRSFLELKAK